jgi:hypothetical protein
VSQHPGITRYLYLGYLVPTSQEEEKLARRCSDL